MGVVDDVDAFVETYPVVPGGHRTEYVFAGVQRADRTNLESECAASPFAPQIERKNRRCDLPPFGDLE